MRRSTASPAGWQAATRLVICFALATTLAEHTLAAQSLEGTWAIEVTPYNCATQTRSAPFWTIQSFTAGGTMTAVTSNQLLPAPVTPALGKWSGAGTGGFSSTYVGLLLFGPTVQPWGHRVTQTISLAGDVLTGEARAEAFVVPGPRPAPSTPVPPVGCATISGRRYP